MKQKRVLVFGTFDGLHLGHLFFLRSAKAQGTYLIAAVARDEQVKFLKNKRPLTHEQARLKAVKKLAFVDEAYLGDEKLGSFTIIEQTSPDLIVLGHDQELLQKDLLRWMSEQNRYIPMIRAKKI